MRAGWTGAFVTVGIMLLDAQVALARAGGGGGYSSGGSSSSSSFSSSSGSYSGSGGSGGQLGGVELVVLAIVFVAFLVSAGRRGREARAAEHSRQVQSQHIAQALRERDPHFGLARFQARVREAFLRIQAAWSSQDLSAVRGFMSDGVHERFSIQLREQEALGYRNDLRNVKVHSCQLVDLRAHEHFDVVAVRIEASAVDLRVDLESGREIKGSRRAERFTEIWSFLRGRHAQTSARDGLFEGQCPNCAAPIVPERAWSCEACGSELSSAPPDWVLVEITQRAEWRGGAARREPIGLKQAQSQDPGLTVQQLEDRASVLYWRLMDSERTGEAAALESVARPQSVARQRQWLAERGRHYIGDCAVGSVELRGFVPGREWDLALVEIRWAGGGFERHPDQTPRSTGGRCLRRSLLVMARRCGAQSEIGRCITSAHCGSCGAPDEGALDGRCGFCGQALADGREWILDRFLGLHESEAGELLLEARRGSRPALSEPEAEREKAEHGADPVAPAAAPRGAALYGWCLALAYVDQHLDRREREGLKRLASRLALPSRQARDLMRAAQHGRLEVERPASVEEATRWLESLEALARVDGRLDRRERRTLSALAEHTRRDPAYAALEPQEAELSSSR